MRDDFCVFILTHGRPDNVKTVKALEKCGYTGKIYFVVDNEDKTVLKYADNFGDENIKVFNKKYYADLIDECDNFDERRTTTHARNACFDIAEELGITYFLQLDDDYTNFRWRFVDRYITSGYVHNFDSIVESFVTYLENTSIKSICFAQGGDFIGGEGCGLLQNYQRNCRKVMNSFFCSTKKRFWFIGSMNEDVNVYTLLGSKGDLFLTMPHIGVEQAATQVTKGAITDKYKKYGTYCKSFMTVILLPSSVSVAMMGFTQNRLHHRVKWINTAPMIVSEKHKK